MTQETAIEVLKLGSTTFLTGEPGAGKSYVVNLYKKYLEENDIPYAVTASTGIAATHIDGITIHSFCGIGIKEKITEADVDVIIRTKPKVVDNIKRIEVLIIDEISMLSDQTLDNVEFVINSIRREILSDQPFGGIQVIFVGDYFQLPPISKDKNVKVGFAYNAKAWVHSNPVVCYLTEQHRQQEPVFTEILTAFRNGILTDAQKKLLVANNVKAIPQTKLYTHNYDVDRMNTDELHKIKGNEYTYWMETTGNDYLADMLKKHCLSPEKLLLKKGALVMFTRNNFDVGYVNGTLGTVIDLSSDRIVVETKHGAITLREKAEWSISEDTKQGHITKASIKQYPLRLAWAITVHKSQGMSLDSAVIDLSKSFEYGQGYVAISRVCSLSGLYIEGINKRAFEMHPEVVVKDKEFREKSALMEIKFKKHE